jgi:molybdate transport system substrate-binding protein
MRIALRILVIVALAGCDGQGDEELLVSAAASLSGAFAEIELAFEEAHPEMDLILNLGGSSALREQILGGAPVHIFASANMSNMDEVVAAGQVVGDPRVFAVNRLEIAVPAGNPAGVNGLDDFSDDGLLLGLCAEAVPCGGYAREVLANAGVTPAIDTNEPDVRALLTKIEAGELDAGITYVTDVASAGETIEGVEIPDSVNVAAEYSIAVLAGAANEQIASAFIELVLSDEGQAILSEYGFSSP